MMGPFFRYKPWWGSISLPRKKLAESTGRKVVTNNQNDAAIQIQTVARRYLGITQNKNYDGAVLQIQTLVRQYFATKKKLAESMEQKVVVENSLLISSNNNRILLQQKKKTKPQRCFPNIWDIFDEGMCCTKNSLSHVEMWRMSQIRSITMRNDMYTETKN